MAENGRKPLSKLPFNTSVEPLWRWPFQGVVQEAEVTRPRRHPTSLDT